MIRYLLMKAKIGEIPPPPRQNPKGSTPGGIATLLPHGECPSCHFRTSEPNAIFAKAPAGEDKEAVPTMKDKVQFSRALKRKLSDVVAIPRSEDDSS